MSDTPLLPVILAGGSGTRLWPLSRASSPKQLLSLGEEQTLLQSTALRTRKLAGTRTVLGPMVVCNAAQAPPIERQLASCGFHEPHIVVEPVGRNTAPAMSAAACIACDVFGPDTLILAMPADHVIQDVDAFASSVDAACRLAEGDGIVAFGVVPDGPETGYGYIVPGAEIASSPVATFELESFVEKPPIATAQELIAARGALWNSGMFLVRAAVWNRLIAQYGEKVGHAAAQSVSHAEVVDRWRYLSAPDFKLATDISIDYAVMEPLTRARSGTSTAQVVSLDAGWSDIGSWSALRELRADAEARDNFLVGDVLDVDSNRSLVMAEHGFVATIGLTETVVVETADAVLVMDANDDQRVREVVDTLNQHSRAETQVHVRNQTEWGEQWSLSDGGEWGVSRLKIRPQTQMHITPAAVARRWLLVAGEARAVIGETSTTLAPNDSLEVPAAAHGSLRNTGAEHCELVEISIGVE
ncbi:MAG: mannose-1-phosphate guanylyltransferase/mannose-6-phosphate isomerase [Gammaproteobacteria bacterium]|nr:mannose-1-phosphate guanylyltransferase/mannose-6-phosphate isomerase [Gammaproteobacteria bacterium]